MSDVAIYNLVKNAIFCTRRVDRGLEGGISSSGNFVVASAQARNAIDALSSTNNFLGRQAKHVVSSIDDVAKTSSFMGYAAKGLNFASKAVNPLICVSGGIKVLAAEDKDREFINQFYALSTMFAFEKTAKLFLTPEGNNLLAKKGINNKVVKSIIKFVSKYDGMAKAPGAPKYLKFGVPAIKALTFICASIAGYSLGSKAAGKINESLDKQKNPTDGTSNDNMTYMA